MMSGVSSSADSVPPLGDATGRGRGGNLRSSLPTRTRIVAAAALVGVGGGLATWGVVDRASRQGITRVATADDCPPVAGPLPPPRDGLDQHLVPVLPVPVGPIRAVICRYPVPGPVGPAATGAVLDATRTAEVAGWLDDASVLAPPGTTDCPESGGPTLVMTFRYADGPPVQVTARSDGCRRATNGVRLEIARAEVVARIDRLIPSG